MASRIYLTTLYVDIGRPQSDFFIFVIYALYYIADCKDQIQHNFLIVFPSNKIRQLLMDELYDLK